jgi:HEAT repeat protein
MKSSLSLLLPAVAAFCLTARAAFDGPGSPTPLDTHHLLVIRPADFSDSSGKKLPPAKLKDNAFETGAVPIAGAITAPVTVRHAGNYTLWVRIGISDGGRFPANVSLDQGEKTLLAATVGDNEGAEGLGGAAGFEAYRALAAKGGVFRDASVKPDATTPAGKAAAKDGDDLDKELRDLRRDITGGKTWEDWATPDRLEEPQKARPFYWWKVGAITLDKGAHHLRLRVPSGAKAPPGTALLDAAFLTTNDKLLYPFVSDINAPRASYIRFRIDTLPKAGALLTAALRIHYEPWSTPRVSLNPARLSALKSEPHTQTGYTRWYRLQDIERAPAFGTAEAQLLLGVAPTGKTGEKPAGATQFAVFPHQDFVLREIGWNEPEGLNLSMATDFETHLHQLRTLRDHAREHYEMALRATEGQLFPLTRGDLHFGNAWGGSSGDTTDYLNKTLRLLGFNSVGASDEPVKYRALYGWKSHGGHYWPPTFLPFDEEDARRQYDGHYRNFFDAQKEFYSGVSTFQIADEPGEISRGEMSSPLWRFGRDERGEKWEDAVGGSDLHTRRCDYHDCVLEGKVEQHGRWFGFRVAVDNALKPERYAWWHLGAVSVNREMNLSIGRSDKGGPTHSEMQRLGASVAPAGTAFKIVYHGTSAALYLNGKMIQQQDGLPPRGGFGFTGQPKAIRELRLRPIQKGEFLSAIDAGAEKQKTELTDLGLEDAAGKAADFKAKPLEQFVEEDWTPAGGMPQAHAAFRKWAAAQGVQPALFGAKNWDDVRMLTVASLVRTREDARLFYWSRKFSGWLTPRMFNLAAEAIHQYAPNKEMRGFVALSGHSLYFPSEQPLDMFQLAEGPAMLPGISDWMSLGSWFWDSHQAVAFSVAPYNAGARRYGQSPVNFPMMHCVWPSTLRAYTMLANNVRCISYFNFGPSYAVTEGFWSESEGSYRAVHLTNNRSAQVDDVLASSQMRPSRVAMLYSMANEYWNPQSSFADKRASFLALSHEYYQPELVTDEQVAAGALKHYDALYVLDPIVPDAVREKIAEWTKAGGLLWTCADALSRNEFNEPADAVKALTGIERKLAEASLQKAKPTNATKPGSTVTAIAGQSDIRAHTVAGEGLTKVTAFGSSKIRARYDDGGPAWIEAPCGKGKVVFIGHRAGLTYTQKKIRLPGHHPIWADAPRAPLIAPLIESGVERELVLSDPAVMASPMSSTDGTVIILHNMQPTPRRDLKLSLREPASPHSVAAFTGGRLAPLPFEFREGRAWFTLPELAAEQMILVRRKPAPADPRDEELRVLTQAQLKSKEPAALAAGAWTAGFHPEWKLAPQVAPMLAHPRWEVRRAAAEALGRIGERNVADSLAAALKQETDAHVLGDGLVALARLDHAETNPLCAKSLSHPDAFVRRQALTAAGEGAGAKGTTGAADKQFASDFATQGLSDPDRRVRRAAFELLVNTDPARAVERLAAAFAETDSMQPAERNDWAQTAAGNDAAFGTYLKRGKPGGTALLLAIASHRADPALAAALAPLALKLDAGDIAQFAAAARQQQDKALAKSLFETRNTLPPAFASHLTTVLEYAFEARLGADLADWERLLGK